ncbi:hypothetical protein ACFFRR_010650 [Megaselia abdita]
MPVKGIKCRNAEHLSFSWTSFRTISCVIFLIATVIDTGFTSYMVFDQPIQFSKIEPLIFHILIVLVMLNLLKLSRKWDQIIKKWQKVEETLPRYEKTMDRTALSRRINSIAFVFFMAAFAEHLLSTISALHFANYCPARKDPIESYFFTTSSQLFYVFEYNSIIAWIGKLENTLLTFAWNFADVFLMIIGVGLSSKFQQVNDHLDRHKYENKPESFWEQSPEHLLSTISALHFANYCPARKDPIESYFFTTSSQLFYVFEYNSIIAWIGKLENTLLTFAWNFADVFLMIIGVGLSSKFQQVNDHLDRHKYENKPESFWERSRLQYRSICILVEEMDNEVSTIVLLSFTNNLYFVCMQFLKSIK